MLHQCVCLMLVTTVDELEHELFFREISTNANYICASRSHDPSLVVWLAICSQALVILSHSRLSQFIYVFYLCKLHIYFFLFLCHI